MFGLKLKLYLLASLAAMAGLVGIYWSGVRRGADNVRDDINRKRLKAIEESRSVEAHIEGLDDDALRGRTERWTRK